MKRIAATAAALVVLVTGCGGSSTGTSTDLGRCQRMASSFEDFRTTKLQPIVDAGAAASGGSFQAVAGDLGDVIDDMDTWSTGMKDSALRAKFQTAIGKGRTALAVIPGGSLGDSAEAITDWLAASNTAFEGCPSS